MSLVQAVNGGGLDVPIDREAILRSLNLNPQDPKTQALILVCDRYQLDPLLRHMVLISGNPYVTRDGYLAIAHRSGVFDGMEVVSTGADQTHYIAKVSVYRKDMGRPFTMVGRFPKSKSMAKEYGPEMAIKVAEVAALRRAFNITGVGAADERWDDEAEQGTRELGPAEATERPPSTGRAGKTPPSRFHTVGAAKGLSEEQRRAIITEVSDGRTNSAGELTPPELAAAMAALERSDPTFDLAQRVADISGRCAALPPELLAQYTEFRKASTPHIPTAQKVDGWTPDLCEVAESMLLTLEESNPERPFEAS